MNPKFDSCVFETKTQIYWTLIIVESLSCLVLSIFLMLTRRYYYGIIIFSVINLE